jgi:hypothetical protein
MPDAIAASSLLNHHFDFDIPSLPFSATKAEQPAVISEPTSKFIISYFGI